MRGRVEEEAGRGETTTKQTSAVVIVIFMECLPSARPCAQHFTSTNSFNSHNSSVRCILLLSQCNEWGNWSTEFFITQSVMELEFKSRPGFSTLLHSVAKSCPTFYNPMDCGMPGFSALHHPPEFTQTHVHWVRDAIWPSHPLSSPSPPTFNLSQHQDLFKWISSSHQVAKVLEFQLQHQSFQ